MKQLFTAIFILIPVFSSTAQDNEEFKIIFENTLHNFGIINKGFEAECVFTFVNKSQRPVAITSVSASCGCTVPKWSKKPVMPNNAGEIKVKYNTNITGSFVKTITVLSTSEKRPVILTIKGEVRRK